MINWLKNIFQRDVVVSQEAIDFKSFLFSKKNLHGKKLKIKAFGISMWPLIKEGESVEVEVLSANQIKDKIKKGLIVAFYSSLEEKIIIHRVIEVRQEEKGLFFLTKGDNLNEEDLFLVPSINVLGLVKT